MSQTVPRDEKPGCFGQIHDPPRTNGWDPASTECAGGIDAAFTDEKTGSHIRKKCDFYHNCGSTSQARKMEQMRAGLVPAQTLVRPVVGQPRATPVVVGQPQNKLAEAMQQQQMLAMQQQQQQMMMQQMQKMGQMAPPQMMMPMGYQQMMPVNYQMPGYLTSPETEGGFWEQMARTVFRSMGKSVGHSVAHMFDHIPLGRRRSGE